jgi:hypothetical protein
MNTKPHQKLIIVFVFVFVHAHCDLNVENIWNMSRMPLDEKQNMELAIFLLMNNSSCTSVKGKIIIILPRIFIK